jgi:hypothetical protein
VNSSSIDITSHASIAYYFSAQFPCKEHAQIGIDSPHVAIRCLDATYAEQDVVSKPLVVGTGWKIVPMDRKI